MQMQMKVNETVDDLVLIARLRLYLEACPPEQLMARCQDGDTEALDVLCQALPAIRKRAGLSMADMLGADLGSAIDRAQVRR